jgi:hypothetical protein
MAVANANHATGAQEAVPSAHTSAAMQLHYPLRKKPATLLSGHIQLFTQLYMTMQREKLPVFG